MKFDHLKDLPKAESLLAMDILWRSLSQNPTEDLTPLWHQQVLAARLERLKSGQENCLPWDQAKERLRTLTRQTPSHCVRQAMNGCESIEITQAAQDDLLAAYWFYEQQQAGIGAYFLNSLCADTDAFQISTGVHVKVQPSGALRSLGSRFAFAIYY